MTADRSSDGGDVAVDRSGDPIAAFARLAPAFVPVTVDELAAIRTAAFTVAPPLLVGDAAQDVAPLDVHLHLTTQADERSARLARSGRRARVTAVVAAAASTVALLAGVHRADTSRRGGGPSSTVPSIASTVATASASTPASTFRSTAESTDPTSAASSALTTPSTVASATGPVSVSPSLVDLPNERLDPLQAFFSGTENSARLRRSAVAGEPYIAACMRERGWTYQEQQSAPSWGVPQAVLQALDPEGFRRRYGYGIVASQVQGGLGLDNVDPNGVYLETLSDEQRAAWSRDLNGEYGADGKLNLGGAKPCTDAAWDAVAAWTAGLPKVDLGLAAVDPKNDPAKDARVVAADDRWAACMKRRGYDAVRSLGGSGLVYKKVAAAAHAVVQSWDPSSGEFPSLSDAQRAELQAYEVEIAGADHGCDLEVGLSAARSTASAEIAARLRAEYPGVVIEPYDPNMR